MKASVSSWSYRKPFGEGKTDLLSFVDEVKRQKADGLEILPGHVNPKDVGGHLKQVAAKARKLRLEISSVILGNDFARPSAKDRGEQVERAKQWIAWTAGAGIERMNTFTGYHAAGQDPFMEACRVIDAYREIAPLAEKHGVVLCIENHSTVCADADGLLHVIRGVGSSHVRTNPDPSNFVADFTARNDRAREVIYAETAKIAPFAGNAHLKIGDFRANGEHAFLDVKRILGIFRKAGFDGHVVLEVYGAADDPAETCAKGLALLRRYF